MAATAKLRVEVCIISARGLPRGPAFLKPQWFAVGWVDPDNKYCTKIAASGSANPTWKTKFSFPIDTAADDSPELTVEVYKREPIFLREKLHGTAVIALKEFLERFLVDAAARGGLKESGSFQLRKRNSGKPQGFVDVAIAVSEKAGVSSTSRREMDERFGGTNKQEGITFAVEDDRVFAFPPRSQSTPFLGDHQLYSNHSGNNNSYVSPRAPPPYGNSPPAAYLKPPTPPPPPPCNAGFLPALFPSAAPMPETYSNFRPSSGAEAAARRGSAPSGAGFGMGLGAGALAAGAVIFGDDFMSGSHFPAGLDGGSLTNLTADDTLF